MAFRFFYNDTDTPNRIKTAAAADDPIPTRGTLDGTAPIGTRADVVVRDYAKCRLVMQFTDGAGADTPLGTADITAWFRDMPELGDASTPGATPAAPAANKILWVRSNTINATGVTHLEEFILEDMQKRAVYIQIENIAAATDVRLYLAPFDRSWPMQSLD